MPVEFGFLCIQFPSYRVVNRHIRGVENTMPLQRRNSWPLGGSGRSVVVAARWPITLEYYPSADAWGIQLPDLSTRGPGLMTSCLYWNLGRFLVWISMPLNKQFVSRAWVASERNAFRLSYVAMRENQAWTSKIGNQCKPVKRSTRDNKGEE